MTRLLQIPQQRFHSLIVVDVFFLFIFFLFYFIWSLPPPLLERRQIKIDFSEQTVCWQSLCVIWARCRFNYDSSSPNSQRDEATRLSRLTRTPAAITLCSRRLSFPFFLLRSLLSRAPAAISAASEEIRRRNKWREMGREGKTMDSLWQETGNRTRIYKTKSSRPADLTGQTRLLIVCRAYF